MSERLKYSQIHKAKLSEGRLEVLGSAKFHWGVVIGGKLYFGFEITRQFLSQALKDLQLRTEVDLNALYLSKRNIEITNEYVLNNQPLKDIAEKFGISRQRVNQITEATLTKLWKTSLPQTQKLFPLSSLQPSKLATIEKSRKMSLAHSKLFAQAEAMLKEGATYEELRQTLDPEGKGKLSGVRITLKKYGIEIPYVIKRPQAYRQLREKLADLSLTDRQVQKLLNQVTLHFYQTYVKENPQKIIFPLAEAARLAGFHFKISKLQLFERSLKRARLPSVRISYSTKSKQVHYYIAAQHLDRAQKIWIETPELKPFLANPVTQIAGPKADVPNTTEIFTKKQFIYVGKILRQLGIKVAHLKGKKIDNFLGDDCPIPVFKYTRKSMEWYGVYCRIQDEQSLKKYLQGKFTSGPS